MMRSYYAPTKKVTAKNLKVGDELASYTRNGRQTMGRQFVSEVTPFKVGLRWRQETKTSEWVEAETTIFEVYLSEVEIIKKYKEKAENIYQQLQNKLALDEIGEHEFDNSWLSVDPVELAVICEKKKYKILGYCTDIVPKLSWTGEELGFAIVAEEEDGYRFWCHYFNDFLDRVDWHNEYNKRKLKGEKI